ncbi:hypothetical protein SCUCBS95973_008687, partial [Sporothrix curviconia]
MASEANSQFPDDDKVRNWAFLEVLELHVFYNKGRAAAPSVFVVYAHNSEDATEPTAHADVAIRYIGWLNCVLQQVISDKTPIVDSGHAPLSAVYRADGNPSTNILKNQMRLLPSLTLFGPGENCGSFANVVVYGSALLRDQLSDASTLDEKLYEPLRTYKCGKEQPEGFHHVLTELAFLQIRRNVTGAEGIIFPVALDGKLMPYLPFLRNVYIHAKIDPKLGVKNQHRNFIKLMKQIFEYSKFCDDLGKLYDEICQHVQEKTDAGSPMTQGAAEDYFSQLRTELIKKTTANSSTRPPDLVFGVSRSPSPCFVPRESILKDVEKQLFAAMEQKLHKRIGLVGASGFGKTQLAIHVAHRWKERGHVFWVTGKSFNEFLSSCQCMAVRARLCGKNTVDAAAVQKLMAWLESSASGHWLFVIDDMVDCESESNLLARLLPKSCGAILVTARTSSVSILQQGTTIVIERMQEPEAIKLCEVLTRNTRYALETIKQFVAKLAYYPLAIVQAAAHLQTTGKSLLDYLLLQTLNLDHFRPPVSMHNDDGHLDDECEKPLRAILVPTFEAVVRKNAAAGDVLQVMARLNIKSIPRTLLLAGTRSVFVLPDESAFGDAMGCLLSTHLVMPQCDMRQTNETAYELHDMVAAQLINDWAQHDCVRILDMAASLLHAAYVEGRIFPVLLLPQFFDLDVSRAFVLHADGLVAALQEGDVWQRGSAEQQRRWLDVVRQCGFDHLMVRHIKEARQYLAFYCTRFCDAGETGDKTDRLRATIAFGLAYKEECDDVAAEKHYGEALRLFASLDDDDNTLKKELTNLLRDMDEYPQAMVHMKAAQAVWNGNEPPPPLRGLGLYIQGCLGGLLLAMGHREEAFAELNKAIRGWMQYTADPAANLDQYRGQQYFIVKADLAQAYSQRRDHGEANRLFQEALESAEATLGPDHLRTLKIKTIIVIRIYHTLSVAEKVIGELTKALESVEHVMRWWQADTNHEQKLGYYEAVKLRADIQWMKSEYRDEDAKKAYQEVQEGIKKLGLSTTHLLQRSLWLSQANLMLAMRDFKASEYFLRKWKDSPASLDMQS